MESKRHQVYRNSLCSQCLLLLEPYKLSAVPGWPLCRAMCVTGFDSNVRFEGLSLLSYILQPHYTHRKIRSLISDHSFENNQEFMVGSFALAPHTVIERRR